MSEKPRSRSKAKGGGRSARASMPPTIAVADRAGHTVEAARRSLTAISARDDDNPEWTAADFARARPASEILPAAVAEALVKNKGGRPRGTRKQAVSIRLDMDVLEKFKATGRGWQSRINDALRRARV